MLGVHGLILHIVIVQAVTKPEYNSTPCDQLNVNENYSLNAM